MLTCTHYTGKLVSVSMLTYAFMYNMAAKNINFTITMITTSEEICMGNVVKIIGTVQDLEQHNYCYGSLISIVSACTIYKGMCVLFAH